MRGFHEDVEILRFAINPGVLVDRVGARDDVGDPCRVEHGERGLVELALRIGHPEVPMRDRTLFLARERAELPCLRERTAHFTHGLLTVRGGRAWPFPDLPRSGSAQLFPWQTPCRARPDAGTPNEAWAPSGVPRGPGESRTRVLHRINHSVYVRSPPIDVSDGWLVNDPPPDKLSKFSPRA